MLMILSLTACSTTRTIEAPNSSKVAAVPCPALQSIHYNAPHDSKKVKDWVEGTLPDPSNTLDTPSTVRQIVDMNAAISAVCKAKP